MTKVCEFVHLNVFDRQKPSKDINTWLNSPQSNDSYDSSSVEDATFLNLKLYL